MEKYTVGYKIRISHDYYSDSSVPLTLSPTIETKAILLKNNMHFKRIGTGEWVLLCLKGDKLKLNRSFLTFEVRITEAVFYYVTGREVNTNDETFTISDPEHPMSWKILRIHITEETENDYPIDIHWQIPTVEMFFEFICIPKYHPIDLGLKMDVDKNTFHFIEPENISLPGEGYGILFRSKEPIPLRNIYKHKIRLWEVRDSGERLISDNIPCPNPSERSVFNPNDTITTYYYF